jgi:AbrB family looped-hinge helix DNA binding protein
MRITSKGQVTIPVEIRQQAGLLPGTEVTFSYEQGVVRLTSAGAGKAAGRSRGLVERLRGSATVRITADEVMALTRGE